MITSRRHAAATAPGLQRLLLRQHGQTADVSLTAATPELSHAAGKSRLMWSVRMGAECVRNLSLACNLGGAGRVRCQ